MRYIQHTTPFEKRNLGGKKTAKLLPKLQNETLYDHIFIRTEKTE